MTLYIYHNAITFDKEEMDDYIFNRLSRNASTRYAENHMDYEWDNVEEEDCDLQGLLEWLRNGYFLLEHYGKNDQ
jgi:hypothetical protein